MHNHDTGALKARKYLTLGVALLWLTGCYPPSAVERDWGNSVRNNIAQQVLNPQAGLNPAPAVGLSPQAAVNEMDNYNNSFMPEKQKGQLYGSPSGSQSGSQSSGQ